MSNQIAIPADMVQQTEIGPAVSIRDMLVALGADDQTLRDHDEKDEILTREPWRKDELRFVQTADYGKYQIGHTEGKIDWTGTRFQPAQE